MAALAAGSSVVTSASVYFGAPHRARPKMGICESAIPGPPPTTVVVDWEDGTQTTYAASGSLSTSVLFQTSPPTHPQLLGFIASVSSVAPNPGSRVQGPVVAHFNVLDPSGGTLAEIVVISTPTGFVSTPYAFVTVIPSA